MVENNSDGAGLSMIIGGAASGKSAFAERLVIAQGGPRYYIATAQPFDDEMREKIATHKAARADNDWRTIEAPFDLPEAVAQLPQDGSVLIDCATLWLTNLIMADRDIAAETALLIAALHKTNRPTTIVTNEIGQGVIPEHAMARKFQSVQGRFNIQLASEATRVVHIVAGLPNVIKGQL